MLLGYKEIGELFMALHLDLDLSPIHHEDCAANGLNVLTKNEP